MSIPALCDASLAPSQASAVSTHALALQAQQRTVLHAGCGADTDATSEQDQTCRMESSARRTTGLVLGYVTPW